MATLAYAIIVFITGGYQDQGSSMPASVESGNCLQSSSKIVSNISGPRASASQTEY